jgi:segregation and condensation protein B
MEKGLVRIAGRDDSLGRPVLYGTTKKFLQLYGLNSLRELPAAEGVPPPKRAAAPPAETEDDTKRPRAGDSPPPAAGAR